MGCFSTDGPCLQKESLYEVVLTTSRSVICYAEDDGLGEELGSEAFCPHHVGFIQFMRLYGLMLLSLGCVFEAGGRTHRI
jgi:hypothetical protein